MRRPLGALSHHNFVQLSQTCNNYAVSFTYNAEQSFRLSEEIKRHQPEIERYWRQESPELRDFESIVCVQKAVTQSSHTPQSISDPGWGQISLTCCHTTYFQFLFSNYSLDIPLHDRTTLREKYETGIFRKLKKDEIFGEAKTEVFEFPSFGNSLGITVSIVTDDKQLIVAKRSNNARVARDKGNWLCAVGTQVKRHQPRFLNHGGVPLPDISAWEGLRDEMGILIANNCHALRCLGLVYREDFHHCELIYEVMNNLTAARLLEAWRETEIPDRQEFERIEAIDISRPEPLLEHLSDQSNKWSPQHAAGALHSLALRFPNELKSSGLQL